MVNQRYLFELKTSIQSGHRRQRGKCLGATVSGERRGSQPEDFLGTIHVTGVHYVVHILDVLRQVVGNVERYPRYVRTSFRGSSFVEGHVTDKAEWSLQENQRLVISKQAKLYRYGRKEKRKSFINNGIDSTTKPMSFTPTPFTQGQTCALLFSRPTLSPNTQPRGICC